MTTQAQATAEILSTFRALIAEIDATAGSPDRTDLILVWDNGLAVKFFDGKPQAVGLLHAEAIVTREQAAKMPEEAWAYIPQITNGHGERARLLPRNVALVRERANLEALIEKIAA